jgi:hypothetical protein
MQCSKIIFSLYRLIGAAEQRERKGDAEHLGGFHLMISSTLEDRRTGRSPGFSPLRILPV